LWLFFDVGLLGFVLVGVGLEFFWKLVGSGDSENAVGSFQDRVVCCGGKRMFLDGTLGAILCASVVLGTLLG
jgi:hypothetical protein